MSIEITKEDDRKVHVNEKVVYKDTNDNWVCDVELTNSEKTSLNDYLKSNHLL